LRVQTVNTLGGYWGRIAHYDLTQKAVKDLSWNEEEFLPFVGGRGFTALLLYKLLPPGVKPLSPDNVLIFAAGPFVGTKVPSSSRWSVGSKSPLTGLNGTGNGGGNFGPALKWAGLDALVISGKASHPSYLFVDNGSFSLKPADHLWGKSPAETSLAIRSELGVSEGDPHLGIAAIGRAGEEGVSLSIILSKDHSAGRGGLGAVMGSKNLKAVVVRGSQRVEVADPQALNIKARQMTDEVMRQNHYPAFIKYGSMSALRDRYAVMGGFLTFNGQKGSCPHLDCIDGNAMYPYLWPSESCFGCPMPCTHYFSVEGGKYGPAKGRGVQAATSLALGAQCGMTDIEAVLKAHAQVNHYGLDLISAPVVIAFAMECYQRGIIGRDTTEGLDLSWANANDAVLEAIELMGQNEGFGRLLNRGVKALSEEWGEKTKSFAFHVKGMETTDADPRVWPTWGLMYAVSSRGADHCRAMCFAEMGAMPDDLLKKVAGTTEAADPNAIKGKGKVVAYCEDLRALDDSLTLCKFITQGQLGYPEHLADLFSSVTGLTWSAEKLRMAGERIVQMERLFNLREGLTSKDDTLPERFLSEPVPDGPAKGRVVRLAPMLEEYYLARGWDERTGEPMPERLEKLGLKK
jgi:aldehyde:ferredoxin oxidoreductase